MSIRYQLSRRLAAGLGPALALLCLSSAAAQPAGLPGTTITVNSLGDGPFVIWPGQPPPCRLRDAIEAANTNLPVGGCPAGVEPHLVSVTPLRIDFIDRIVFNVGAGTPRIQLRSGLPHITEAVTIDGATGGATRVEIAGGNILSVAPVHGLVATGTDNTFKSLVINAFSGHGIALTHEDGDGIVIIVPGHPDERPTEVPDQPIGDPCGPDARPADPDCFPGSGPHDDVDTIGGGGGGGGNTVLDCLIGTDKTGDVAVPNGWRMPDSAGIAVLSPGNTIGGTTLAARNVIAAQQGYGVLLDSRNNRVIGNLIGTGVSPGVALGNQSHGIFVAGGGFSQATGIIQGNTIANNGGDGVDAGYNWVSILANRIDANGGLGIERAEAGVTDNDPTTGRISPPHFPVLLGASLALSGTTISGELTQFSLSPIAVQVFYNRSCDPSGNGEGATYLGSATVAGGVNVPFQVTTSRLYFQGSFTATATTSTGTSEFSACLTK